ncbi:MAG: substrate-binding domain-containing protein [bacterium]|jgi:ribose transport system substrate-binding protein|nr:substrate-binding domain-containing protein [bacterium]
MKRIHVLTCAGLLCALALVLVLGGCGSKEATDSTQTATREIAVVPKGTSHIFWQAVHAGAVTAGKEFGAKILWQGPQTETMKEQQASIVRDFLVRGVDGIVLAPQDKDALVDVVKEVAIDGIPLAIFDSGIETDEYVSFVATDNYKGGVEAARLMAQLMNNKGTCIIVKVDPGSASTIAREQGFEETLAKEFPEIQILGSQYGYSDREKSRAAAEDLLSRFPDVDAIYGPNESSTAGALLALQARQLDGKKIFVGFDSSEELVKALRDGGINGLILQNPFNMGYQGVKAIIDHLEGKEVPKQIDTGVYVITPDTMNTPENQKLLTPDLSILSEE